MPTKAAKMIKSELQYLDDKSLAPKTWGIAKITHFSPICRSPAPFRRIKPWREQITTTAPETAYPGDDRVAARTMASCWDSQVLIYQAMNKTFLLHLY